MSGENGESKRLERVRHTLLRRARLAGRKAFPEPTAAGAPQGRFRSPAAEAREAYRELRREQLWTLFLAALVVTASVSFVVWSDAPLRDLAFGVPVLLAYYLIRALVDSCLHRRKDDQELTAWFNLLLLPLALVVHALASWTAVVIAFGILAMLAAVRGLRRLLGRAHDERWRPEASAFFRKAEPRAAARRISGRC